MADPLTMSLIAGGMGAMKYAGDVSARDNAKKYNSVVDKWGPLLAVNGSKGAPERAMPSANFGADMIPAALTAALAYQGYKPSVSDTPMGPAYAGGGMVNDCYANGGILRRPNANHAPKAAVPMAPGGMVPGRASVPGNSLRNDTQPIMASPGEAVVPREVMAKPTPWKVAAYLNSVKKHGPGPMPVKSMGSKSISPWAAIAGANKG